MTEQSSRLVLHTNTRDEVFAVEHDVVADFSFNSTVANVFDDMVSRSVPFYGEMQRMVCELARDFAQPQSNLYDIGCSTARFGGEEFVAFLPSSAIVRKGLSANLAGGAKVRSIWTSASTGKICMSASQECCVAA
ncbi:hypothetical protein [Rhizobium cauense]|uniref:hypothetical protein n=1 Tax=Rhizobium cauense TaxID=1166683 RepID=UPI001CB77B31|nr:hypothetical protein [Rhizobium cauense]